MGVRARRLIVAAWRSCDERRHRSTWRTERTRSVGLAVRAFRAEGRGGHRRPRWTAERHLFVDGGVRRRRDEPIAIDGAVRRSRHGQDGRDLRRRTTAGRPQVEFDDVCGPAGCAARRAAGCRGPTTWHARGRQEHGSEPRLTARRPPSAIMTSPVPVRACDSGTVSCLSAMSARRRPAASTRGRAARRLPLLAPARARGAPHAAAARRAGSPGVRLHLADDVGPRLAGDRGGPRRRRARRSRSGRSRGRAGSRSRATSREHPDEVRGQRRAGLRHRERPGGDRRRPGRRRPRSSPPTSTRSPRPRSRMNARANGVHLAFVRRDLLARPARRRRAARRRHLVRGPARGARPPVAPRRRGARDPRAGRRSRAAATCPPGGRPGRARPLRVRTTTVARGPRRRRRAASSPLTPCSG